MSNSVSMQSGNSEHKVVQMFENLSLESKKSSSENAPEIEILTEAQHREIQEVIADNGTTTYIKKNCSLKSVAKLAGIGAAVFFSPGIGMRIFGMLTPQASWMAEVHSIASASYTCWTSPLSLQDLGIWGTQLGGAYLFYKHLTDSKFVYGKNYGEWKKDRMAVFQKFHMIPEQYQEDSWFDENKLICPITAEPIRFPVYEKLKDSNGNESRGYYEQSAVYAWIDSGGQYSARTRDRSAPFTKKTLTFDFEMAKKIEERLADLQKTSKKFKALKGLF